MKKSIIIISSFFVISCVSKKVLKYEGPDINVNKEFDQVVKINKVKKPPKLPKTEKAATAIVKKAEIKKSKTKKDKTPKKAPPKKKDVAKKPPKTVKPVKTVVVEPPAPKIKPHLPEMEDGEGFDGRRPLVDPYRVGEKVVLAMTYWNMRAGDLTLETMPYKDVNGRVAYHFVAKLKTSPFFSKIYKMNDKAETFIDFETMRPHIMTINVKETSQLKDIRSFFDWEKNEATYWERKVSADSKKEKKKKIVWEIKDYSQNVLSAPFYLRAFDLKVGKKLKFPVADDGKNIVFSGEVLRKEQIRTKVGQFNTIVVKPQITVDGVFKQVGDIFVWLTDDERKLIVKIQAKIKVGSIIGKLKSIKY